MPAAGVIDVQVCHIISSFRPVIGGAERATESLVGALRAQGIDAIVVTRRYSSELPEFEHVHGVPIYRLGRPGRGKANALSFAAQTLLFLARDLRTYRILHVQNIDTPLLAGMFARVFLRRVLIATIHGETQLIGRSTTWLGRRRMDLMARLVDAFTSINPRNTAALIDVGVSRERIHEIPNGIDTDIFRPPSDADRMRARAGLGIGETDFVALYMGRLQTYKRVDLVVDSWAKLERPGTNVLLVVGEGPEDERLRAQAYPLGKRVRFDGPTDDPVAYLHAADVFVNASGDPMTSWSEGLSVALLEAMSTGLMPIVTSGPGNDVLVTDGETGLSFAVSDEDDLLACLLRSIDEDGLRVRLGRRAHERVFERYSSATVASEIVALYDAVA